MLNLAIVLLVIGILLLVVESCIPGFGVFGVSGLISLVASAVLMVIFVPYGLYVVLIEAAALGAGAYLFLRYFKKSKAFSKIVLNESLDPDDSVTIDLSSYAGKLGTAKTALRPIGTVDFNGVAVEAYSEDGFITAGKTVQVTSTAGGKILVKPVEDGKSEKTSDSQKKGNEN